MLGRIGIALTGILILAIVPLAGSVPNADASTGTYGTLPGPHGTPENGGTVSIAETPGSGPTYIFPVVPAADFTVYTTDQFQYYMWRPLWWVPNGDEPSIDYAQSIAKPPVFSNDNKTMTIGLNNWNWSDGTPVTSTDVAFYIDLLKAAVAISPSNDGNYTPGLFPDDLVSMTTPNASTIVLNFSKSYNPNFLFLYQLSGLYALPAQAWSKTSANGPIIDFTKPRNAKAIYKFLNAQSDRLSTYGTNPLWQTVDGPFKIKSFDSSTGGNTLVANDAYSGPVKPRIAAIDNVAFTSTSAEFNQLLTGQLTVGYVDFSDFPQVAKLEADGYNVWGAPDFGFNYIAYNFKDSTGDFDRIISQLYVRQALAHLQNESALIQSPGVFDGAAAAAYGPVPTVPTSPFAPADALKNPYPFSLAAASTLLSNHGWKVVAGGTTVCARAGSGPNECGTGIPKGTPLTFNLVYANSPAYIGTQGEYLASNAKQIGITIKLESKTFNYISGNLSDIANPDNDNKWAAEDYGGNTNYLYPTTTSVFNTGGSFNQGDFSLKSIDQAIMNSSFSPSANAIENEINLVTLEQPGLFQPNPDEVTAFKKELAGPSASFAASSQFQFSPEYWYFTQG
jgi:peptide/nickel transport system substrate-binding protein